MFCSNCGTQSADGTKFCNNCGAPLTAASPAPAAQPAAQQPVTPPAAPAQEPKKAEKKASGKKSTKILIAVAVFIVAALIGKFAIAPSMTSDSTTTTRPDVNDYLSDSVQQNTTSASSSNSDYDSILTSAYIVHFQPFFGMDTASFVMKTADEIIVCADYGYEDDIVKQWIETMYIPVFGLTDAQKSELESAYRSQLAALEELDCCSVTYSMGNNYLTVECTYSNVDTQSHYSELYYAGFNSENAPISMAATERVLLDAGSVKK